MAAIRGLVDRIEVRPSGSRKPCEVTLVGSLAGLLQFSQGLGKNGTSNGTEDGDGTFLLVAGAGFGQDPTRQELRIAV